MEKKIMRIIAIIAVLFTVGLYLDNYVFYDKPKSEPVDTNAIKARVELKIDSLMQIDSQKTK
jgi:hypothetical protein